MEATARGVAIADELIVRARGDARGIRDLASEVGGEVVWDLTYTDAYVLRFASPSAAEEAAEELAREPGVAEVAVNALARGSGEGLDADALRELQWNLPAVGLGGDGDPAGGEGVRVAILDSGVAHADRETADARFARAPSLEGVPFIAPYDFIRDEPHASDRLGHGTHVASTIASQGWPAPLAGSVEIVPVRVLDGAGVGTEAALAEGIVHAVDSGADVINMSLAFPPSYFPSRFLQEAVDYATARGVVMVGAAGNHADVVVYPGAFRDVLAAGASAPGPGGERGGGRLEPAPYSNAGFLVDFTAPGGRIDRDALGTGYPDAIAAESFDGDPASFEPILFAGTSQAAAHVTSAAASVLAHRGDLSPWQVRAVLGETAEGSPRHLRSGLDAELGRGHIRMDRAQLAASDGADEAPRYFAGAHVSIEEPARPRGRESLRFARAEVEILDGDGRPVRHAIVHGSFAGAAVGAQTARTDREGIATFRSRQLRGEGRVASFRVEAVIDARRGVVDRPAGFLRTDSCSLDLLATYAEEIGLTGVGTSPSGVGTSPSAPLAMSTDDGGVDTVSLLNFSWSGATVPMAVAADEAWFREHFDGVDDYIAASEGIGIGSRPMRLRESSFPISVEPSAPEDGCLDLLLSTFAVGTQGVGTSPSGVGTSPSGVGTSPSSVPIAPAPGVCGDRCEAYRSILAALWRALAAGEDLPGWSEDLGISGQHYDHLAAMIEGYEAFADAGASSPVASYVAVLSAAGLSPAPEGGDEGAGYGMSQLE